MPAFVLSTFWWDTMCRCVYNYGPGISKALQKMGTSYKRPVPEKGSCHAPRSKVLWRVQFFHVLFMFKLLLGIHTCTEPQKLLDPPSLLYSVSILTLDRKVAVNPKGQRYVCRLRWNDAYELKHSLRCPRAVLIVQCWGCNCPTGYPTQSIRVAGQTHSLVDWSFLKVVLPWVVFIFSVQPEQVENMEISGVRRGHFQVVDIAPLLSVELLQL